MRCRRPIIPIAVVAVAASSLLAAGCGGSGSTGSHVAQLGTTTQGSARSTGSTLQAHQLQDKHRPPRRSPTATACARTVCRRSPTPTAAERSQRPKS